LALNSLAAALMAALQTLLLDDLQVTRAIVSWGFGGLNDRGATHAMIVWTGAAFALTSIPLIGLELDLLAGGESDAEALGANTARVKPSRSPQSRFRRRRPSQFAVRLHSSDCSCRTWSESWPVRDNRALLLLSFLTAQPCCCWWCWSRMDCCRRLSAV